MMTANSSSKILVSFFKIVSVIIAIVSAIFLIESAGRGLLNSTRLTENTKNIIVAITESAAAVMIYILLFQLYDKRKISELSLSSFFKYATVGFLGGLIFQSLFVLIIFLAGGYTISKINPLSFLLPGLSASLTAGFVAEIIIIGVVFQWLEKILGTLITLVIFTLLFAVLHINKQASMFSVAATALQAGFLIPAIFILTRNLWAVIFFHFAWDLAEPAIYGGINPGISETSSLFTPNISGSSLLTGGPHGPQNSLQAIIACLISGVILLMFAKPKKKI
jgi:membrane protease YdiL (CAAX protease family)